MASSLALLSHASTTPASRPWWSPTQFLRRRRWSIVPKFRSGFNISIGPLKKLHFFSCQLKQTSRFRHPHDILSFLAPGYWHLHDPCRGHSQNSQRWICVVPLQPRPLVTNCVYLFIVCCYTKSEKREFPNPNTTNNKALLLTNLIGGVDP